MTSDLIQSLSLAKAQSGGTSLITFYIPSESAL